MAWLVVGKKPVTEVEIEQDSAESCSDKALTSQATGNRKRKRHKRKDRLH